MSIQLFAHNQAAYEAAKTMLCETGKAAVIHPTGTGKSFIGFKLCEEHPESRVCWLSPSSYIFDTQIENLRAVSDGYAPENITFFTYAKLMLLSVSEISSIQPDYIVLDEFHRCGAEMWGEGVRRLLEAYADVPILGLSATAIRYLDNQRDMAQELFEGCVASEITLGEAIVRGILKPPKYVLSAYEYQRDLERYERRVKNMPSIAAQDAAQRYLDALRRRLENADGLPEIFSRHIPVQDGKYLVFCSNADHMREMIALAPTWFEQVDKEPHIYSAYSSDPETSRAFADFKNDCSNHLKLLYCIDMLNEGIHVQDIHGVIMLRPTVSPIIYKQQIGRAMAVNQTQEVVVFDIVMNIMNLYSIDAVQEEMEAAISYYRFLGENDSIVNDHFSVIDELHDCRELFEKLDDALTASWDVMYGFAERYYRQNGDLNCTSRYRTEEGYSLGNWLATQRSVRKGQVHGTLTEEQIAKLDAIGMRWDSKLDVQWERYYQELRSYVNAHGDADVPFDYEIHGVPLGKWIARLRTYRNASVRTGYLTPERVEALNALGMIWDKLDYYWERNFQAAMEYYRIHRNLIVPRGYKTEDGVALWNWIRTLQKTNRSSGGKAISNDRRRRLAEIGLELPSPDQLEAEWLEAYQAAKEYHDRYGDLNVPIYYRSESGVSLGAWIELQRRQFLRDPASYDEAHRAKLNAIGMQWAESTESVWEQYYALAKQYYDVHHHLNPVSNEVFASGELGNWVLRQKLAYRSGALSARQIAMLEALEIDWRDRLTRLWEGNYSEAQQYYEEHGDLNAPAKSSIRKWLNQQRKSFQNGKLPPEQIEKLNAIGMVWETDDGWEQGFQEAERFYRAHSHLDIPAQYVTESGFALGQWYRTQRNAVREGSISNERFKQLERIGFQRQSVRHRNWMRDYEEAKKYFESHGDLCVPSKYITPEGMHLGTWISTQRNAYRKGTLSEEQIHLLEQIHMEWNRDQTRWDAAFREAELFRNKYGNLSVPPKYIAESGFRLGSWLNQQRTAYRNGKLSPERMKRLESIGISWSRRDRLWEQGFAEAQAYLCTHNAVPNSCITETGFQLGQWIQKQRKKYDAHELDAAKAERLRGIGISL